MGVITDGLTDEELCALHDVRGAAEMLADKQATKAMAAATKMGDK